MDALCTADGAPNHTRMENDIGKGKVVNVCHFGREKRKRTKTLLTHPARLINWFCWSAVRFVAHFQINLVNLKLWTTESHLPKKVKYSLVRNWHNSSWEPKNSGENKWEMFTLTEKRFFDGQTFSNIWTGSRNARSLELSLMVGDLNSRLLGECEGEFYSSLDLTKDIL